MINTYALALKSQSIWEQRYSNSDQHTLTKTLTPSIEEPILEVEGKNHRISLANVMPAIMKMHKG